MGAIQSHARRTINWLPTGSSFSRRHVLLSKESVKEHAKKIEDITDALEQGPPAETINPNVREAFPEIVEMKETVFDISRGKCEVFVDEPLAIELFRPLEELKNSCTKICFGNHSFGVEAALVAKRVLVDFQKTLTDVELEHFVFGRSEDEALEVMSIFSSALEGCMLRSLTLELGQLGEKGVKAFVPLLKSQKTLEKLEFISSNISLESAGAICELLPSIERIESLYFIYKEKGDDAAETLSELIKKCITLEDFNFSYNDISICGAMALGGALGEGSSLRMLDITENMCGVALSQVISGHLGLTEVDLSDMNLQDEGVIAIARSLKDTVPSLRVLSVAGNDITPKAASALAECLAVKNLLTAFYARENKLKDDGSVVICKAISEGHEQLKELDLSANGMTTIGAKAAAEAVANKPNFSGLHISENFITKKGIETVKDVLRKGTKGEFVLGHHYQYKYVGVMQYEQYELREEGITDSDTELE